MFTIRAAFSDTIEIRSSLENVHDFFSNATNFADLMPGIIQIYTDAKGVSHWKVEAVIPMVGKMLQSFAVELEENTNERVEWSPASTEANNFLRYSADFLEKAKNVTMVRFSQAVELRRKSARELHMFAGLAGESLISSEMTKRITEMIRIFIDKAKERLEQ